MELITPISPPIVPMAIRLDRELDWLRFKKEAMEL